MSTPATQKQYIYVSDFLSHAEANDLFYRLAMETFFVREDTGHNDDGSGHDIAVFGRAMAPAYGHSRPHPIQAPQYLRDLKAKIEAHLQTPFNSLQINKHYDGRSKVHPHSDASPGHIAQVTVGAERRFVLKDRDSKSILFDEVLAHGALLDMPPFIQWKMTHEMPEHGQPCGPRFALVFRYVTKSQRNSVKAGSEGLAEWKQAQAEFPKEVVTR